MTSEAQLQRAVMRYLSYALPSDAVALHVPNEGKRSPMMGAELKRQGMLTGCPDIFVLHNASAYAIELKARNGRVRDSQRATFERLNHAGCPVAICRSIDDVHDVLTTWGIPLVGAITAT